MVTSKALEKKESIEIPNYLVYEILDNRKIYYKNYKKVLKGELPAEAVMGSSDLHAWMIDIILQILYRNLNLKKFKILVGEVGYFYEYPHSRKWLNLDIAIVKREKLKKPQGSYLKVPPEVVIEIDTKADLSEVGNEYYIAKTDKLLKSGVKKVIWIFTDVKKIQIAEHKKPWLTVDFDYEFEIIDGIKLNLAKTLKEQENG